MLLKISLLKLNLGSNNFELLKNFSYLHNDCNTVERLRKEKNTQKSCKVETPFAENDKPGFKK